MVGDATRPTGPFADFVNIRKAAREILQKEDDLNEIVQLVGKVRRGPCGRVAGGVGGCPVLCGARASRASLSSPPTCAGPTLAVIATSAAPHHPRCLPVYTSLCAGRAG